MREPVTSLGYEALRDAERAQEVYQSMLAPSMSEALEIAEIAKHNHR